MAVQRQLDDLHADTIADWVAGRDTHIVDRSYPPTKPLQDILRAWNPDNITVPLGADLSGGLKAFDYSVRAAASTLGVVCTRSSACAGADVSTCNMYTCTFADSPASGYG